MDPALLAHPPLGGRSTGAATVVLDFISSAMCGRSDAGVLRTAALLEFANSERRLRVAVEDRWDIPRDVWRECWDDHNASRVIPILVVLTMFGFVLIVLRDML